MKIVTDLNYIARMGEKNDYENVEFRTFLKGSDADLDALVHQLTDTVSAQIDCTTCGNCCKHMKPNLDQADIAEFAQGLEMSGSEFKEQYLQLHANEVGRYVFAALPCPFLQDECCTNYQHRPKNCHSYPHLHKDGFSSRLWGVISNYAICPIVFNVYEQLKAELWYTDEFDAEWY